jgi:hypothetical protein
MQFKTSKLRSNVPRRGGTKLERETRAPMLAAEIGCIGSLKLGKLIMRLILTHHKTRVKLSNPEHSCILSIATWGGKQTI